MRRGRRLLSQISQVVTLDYRDSKIAPHSGYIVELGTDYAGLGGDARFIRGNVNGAYYIPLERQFGNPDWGIKIGGRHWVHGVCFPAAVRKSSTASSWAATICAASRLGGAGPHDVVDRHSAGWPLHLDANHRTALSAAGLARSWLERASVRRCRLADRRHRSRTPAPARCPAIQSCQIEASPRRRALAPVSASPGVPRSV